MTHAHMSCAKAALAQRAGLQHGAVGQIHFPGAACLLFLIALHFLGQVIGRYHNLVLGWCVCWD